MVFTFERILSSDAPIGINSWIAGTIAAVDAADAHYIAGLRGQGKAGEDLQMFTGHQLATVARYSSQVSSQEEFEAWMVGRALDRPEEFLPRLGQALDALVGDRWWVDRDALRARLPVN